MNRTILRWVIGGAALTGLAVAGSVGAQSEAESSDPTSEPSARTAVSPPPRGNGYPGSGAELQAGQWKAGGGLGFLGSTPDGTAFAVNGNMDYFVTDKVSIGPLLQLGVTEDMTQVGLSGQGKYWITLPGTEGRGKVALQSGLGFTHADFGQDDTSWLVPMGVGYDYTLNSGTSLNATALVNLTNLHTGTGSGADVMPGLMFGLRF